MLPRRLALAIAVVCAWVVPAAAQTLTIGFGMALTGGLAPNGKAALLAMQIWESDINTKGGLLGRPVKLIYEELKRRHILVRYMMYEGYGDGLRVSVGSDAEIDRLLEATKRIL